MSGGQFNYVQYNIFQAADELRNYILRCQSEEVDEYGYRPSFSAKTIAKFNECEAYLRIAATMLNRIDWLVSGDDSEETFYKRLDEEMNKLSVVR